MRASTFLPCDPTENQHSLGHVPYSGTRVRRLNLRRWYRLAQPLQMRVRRQLLFPISDIPNFPLD